MVIYLPGDSKSDEPLLDELTPRQIVEQLDRYVIGQADGIQIGGVSTMAGAHNGLQVAGIWNFVFEDIRGVQAALFYNHARYVKGVQIGLFNHCERLDGVQIGLFNTVKESRFSTCPLLRVDF